jgi:hypothetical protein
MDRQRLEGDHEMTPLDPIHARLFPSLAAYAHRLRRRELLALVGIALSVYVLGRDALSAYQGRVATENMLAMVGRINELEAHCQRERPKQLTTSKAQSQVTTAGIERRREGP